MAEMLEKIAIFAAVKVSNERTWLLVSTCEQESACLFFRIVDWACMDALKLRNPFDISFWGTQLVFLAMEFLAGLAKSQTCFIFCDI